MSKTAKIISKGIALIVLINSVGLFAVWLTDRALINLSVVPKLLLFDACLAFVLWRSVRDRIAEA